MTYENPCITLGDYKRLENLDLVSLRFQLTNLVVFHIKNNVLNSSKEKSFLEMADEIPCITLGDYERLDNFDEVSLRFQLRNLVVFDIKSSVLNSSKVK